MSEASQVKSNEASAQDFERELVPAHMRKKWLSMSLVWIAIGIDLSAMFLGAELGNGMNLSDSLTATVIGSVILGLIGALCAFVGAKTGLSTAMISRLLFGNVGARIVSIVLGIFRSAGLASRSVFLLRTCIRPSISLWGWTCLWDCFLLSAGC